MNSVEIGGALRAIGVACGCVLSRRRVHVFFALLFHFSLCLYILPSVFRVFLTNDNNFIC